VKDQTLANKGQIMKIKTVQYLATVNLGNYNNEKIGFTADINEDDDVKQVVEALRQKVKDCALPNADDVQSEIYKHRNELRRLKDKLEKARSEWNATAEFLRSQGIKTDAADMPQFTNLLPAIADERVIDGEIESQDDLF
jgi:acyl-CoA reductase-like NAD-dependent aldehyde dehydrogenase